MLFKKAIQVRAREDLSGGSYEFDAILIDKTLIAMDNGAVLNIDKDNVEVVKKYGFWDSVSFMK